jgi:DNA-binding PucR family transcriptional regulator
MNPDPIPPALERASVPLSALLDTDEFETILVVPRAGADPDTLAEIRGRAVAAPVVIDLDNPSTYLRPGDLLLITGLGLPREEAAVQVYVDRLVEVGTPALVFGIEPVYSIIPPMLVDACARRGLPLIKLPRDVVFAQVVSLLTRALEREQTRTLNEMVTVSRRLTEAALQHRPAQRLLAVLAQASGGWALLRTDDEVLEAGRAPASLSAETVLAAIDERIARRPVAQDAALVVNQTVLQADAEFGVTAYEVTVHSTTRARPGDRSPVLALVVPGQLSRTDRTALELAANLMRLIVSIPTDQSFAFDQLLMHLLTEAPPPLALRRQNSRYTRLLSTALASGRRREAYAVVATRRDAEGVRPSDITILRRLLHTSLVDHRGDSVRGFTARIPSAAAYEQATAIGWSLAVSAGHRIEDLPEAMREATELAEIARATGRHQLGYADQTPPDLWLAESLPAAAGFAERMLAPLDDPAATDTRRALDVWLRHHGSWEHASRVLGLHRNTVRRLVGEAGQRLGRDLDDPLERAKLLLAFSTLSDPVANDGPVDAEPEARGAR